MKKHFLLTKTLLVALLCLVGQSVWAETVNVNSSESAYTLKNSTENFNGSSNSLVAYYTQYRNWGNSDGTANFRNNDAKLVLYKFSLAEFKAASGSMTSATFKFTTTSTENCYNIFAVGYKESWSASTVTGANLINNAGTITGVVTATGSFQPLGTGYASLSNGSKATEMSVDATAYVQSALDANLDYVSFAVGINLTRNLPLNSTAKLSGEFTSASATTYTVKYQNGSGSTLKDDAVYDTFVGETFTASSTDMAAFYSNDASKKYVYASGNQNKTATSTASENVIVLVFNEYDKIAYTITAKSGDENLGTLASGDAYTDGSTSVYWSKYKNHEGKWYETTGNYGKTITESGNVDVPFVLSNISYFFEFETLSRNGGSATVVENNITLSNNTAGRIANSSGSKASLYTTTIAAGTYILSLPYYNGNSVTDADVLRVYATNDIANLGEPIQTFSIKNTSSSIFSAIITVPDGCFLAFQGTETLSSNSKARVDYLTLQSVVPATLGTNGYATFASPYALDLTTANLPSGVTAYKASVSGTTVTFTALNQTVPANTGVLLRGTSTVNIPVAAAGTAVEGNDFLVNDGGATFAGDASYYYFGLVKDSDPLTFRKFDPSATAIPADKAYLKVLKGSVDAARGLEFVFDDEATGVNEVRSQKEDVRSEWFDLQGRKVAQPQKGLYIVNGRKVVVK